jgi:hypothetical protein
MKIEVFFFLNVLRRPPVEHMCWPEICAQADWAARRLYEILFLPV